VVASHHVRRLLVLEGAPPEKINVVRLGVDLEGIQPLTWDEREEKGPSIVFLGRMTPKKHPVALVESFRLVKEKVPAATLTLIGDGPETPRVRERVQQHELGNSVVLHGALPRKEALSIVREHWVYAQHSVTARGGDQEGFGISLAEAAALQLPVVSTLHNGIPEQVVDGETGFLVREHDYEKMAGRLVKLLDTPDCAEKMGVAASDNIEAMCSRKRRTDFIKNVLLQVSPL
jgi:glycosyltransferase involved in cell wall biosynthesis